MNSDMNGMIWKKFKSLKSIEMRTLLFTELLTRKFWTSVQENLLIKKLVSPQSMLTLVPKRMMFIYGYLLLRMKYFLKHLSLWGQTLWWVWLKLENESLRYKDVTCTQSYKLIWKLIAGPLNLYYL
jgi:hypothetical protein